jgi:peptide/nickel transport system substrate-binding protein
MPDRFSKGSLSQRGFLLRAGTCLLLIVVVLFSSATFGNRLVKAQGDRSGTLRVGWTSPVNLDPALFADAPDASIGVAVYDYLFTINPQAEVVPSLAKSFTWSDDSKTLTLTLQSGVKFHDGSDFTSADVKFTLERLQDEKLGSPARGLLKDIATIEAADTTTVTITLNNPVAGFLANLADYHMAILKEGTTEPAKTFNGTGPFKTSADRIDVTTGATFDANENYWQAGWPKIAKLEFTFNKDVSALVQALKGGQLDYVARVPQELFADINQDASLTGSNIPTNLFPNVRLRADRKPGSDPLVRQAFRLAIDRDALNQSLYDGLAAPGYDFPVGPYYKTLSTKPTDFPKRDVAKAKELLTQAGYKDGLNIELYAPSGEFNSAELAQLLQQQLKEASINVDLKLVEGGVYYSDEKNNWLDADFAITGWATRADPQAYFSLMYRSDGIWNESHWNDSEVDKLIDEASKETDNAKRAEIYAKLQAIFIERGPSFIPFFRPALAGQSAKVSGIEANADPGLTNFATAVIAK